jgi:predicted NBD/HSP70 family sugar kinase
MIGLAVANLVSLLDPEIVILGGGVANAGHLLLRPIRAAVRRYAQPLTRSVPIRRSALGNNASLFGCAAIVYRDLQ